MDFRVLGPLEVRAGDGPLPLGGERQRAVLALLLLSANRVVGRERLIHDLWGEQPPETAVATLQAYVSRLRKLLPDGVLLTRPPGYLVVVEHGELDLLRFESLVAKARKAEAERAAQLLREALGLWRGPALAEFASEPFAQTEAARLEDLRLAALEERIEADLALGHHGEVIGELEPAIAEHPYRERLRSQLILALYRSGRQAEALEAFRSARAALDELGIEPSAELRRLEKAILVQDATLGAKFPPPPMEATPLPGPLVPVPSFPFVGRESELAVLRSLVKRAEGGEGSVVLLASQAGGGKTRLVRELALKAIERGVLVLYGSSSATITVPYQPVREWLEFLLRVCDPRMLEECLGSGGDELSRLVPRFAELAGTAVPNAPDAGTDPYLLQSAVADLLAQLGRLRPLLLVTDDMHWSDSGTLQLLGRLARTAPEERMVVLAAFRDRGEETGADLSAALADLSRLESVSRLTLRDLSDEEVRAFIRASTDAEAPRDVVSTLRGLTNGTPLLLCELWRDLLAARAVDVSHESVRLSQPESALHGSERIHDVVRQRRARLSPETSAMLDCAAVAGPQFELRVLADAAELERRALVASVEESITAGMLEELPDLEPACRFTHELVRRAIYDAIRRLRRPELHLRVGEALERIHAADPTPVLPELAHHFTLAAPLAGVERGVDYNLRAAEAATATVSYDEAAASLKQALELGIADPRRRAQVQAELGLLLFHTGHTGESEEILSASLDAATILDERGLALRVLVHRTSERLSSDPDVGSDEIVPIAQEAIRALEQLGDTVGLAAAESLLAGALSREGRTEEALAAFDRALVHAEAAGDQVMRRHIIGRMGLSLCDDSTPVGEAIHRIDELRRSTDGDPVLDAGLCRCRAVLLAMAGRFDEAHELIVATGPILDTAADQSLLSLNSRWMVAEVKDLAGDPAGARQDLHAVFLHMRDRRGEGSEARALRAAADLALRCCDQGDWDEAADYLSYGQRVDQSEPPQGKIYAILRLAARGRLAARRGEIAEGLELARRAVELADRGVWPSGRARARLALAEVQRARGNRSEADAAVAAAIRVYEAKGNVAAVARLRAGAA
jgi:DNA-binding SARP family transcriptional activator